MTVNLIPSDSSSCTIATISDSNIKPLMDKQQGGKLSKTQRRHLDRPAIIHKFSHGATQLASLPQTPAFIRAHSCEPRQLTRNSALAGSALSAVPRALETTRAVIESRYTRSHIDSA
jgi:hypothetical protein